jgi:hypothetical protein
MTSLLPPLFAALAVHAAAMTPAFAIDHSIKVARLTSDSTARRGGSGGNAYNLSCPSGQVLVGITGGAAGYVDRVQGICRDINSSGDWTSTESLTDSAGGPSGVWYTRKCPTNFAVSGFSGRSGWYIERLLLECTRLGPGGTLNTSVARTTLDAVGGSGGTAFSLSRCTNPARAIVGRAGAFVDSIEFACEDDTPLMTATQIDSALSGATTLLRTDSGGGDVAADVRLLRDGRVLITPSNGLFQISSQAELDAACSLAGFAVVTETIGFCGGTTSTAIGCARSGCMIVVPHIAAERPVLWAHEFGHTRTLPHRSGTALLMNSSLASTTGNINTTERDAFQSPVQAITNAFLAAEKAPPDRPALDEFVSRTYFHGMPLEEAAAFGPAAVSQLVAILRDPRREAHWSNAAVMLNMIGDPAGVDAVLAFIRDPGAGELSPQRAWARGNAVQSLGYAASRGHRPALHYLVEGLDPGAWARRGLRGAVGPKPVEQGEEAEGPDDLLSERAAAGLALSGRPEARAAIEERLRVQGLSAGQRHVLQAQLAELGKVTSLGLARYDLERRGQLERPLPIPPQAQPQLPPPGP